MIFLLWKLIAYLRGIIDAWMDGKAADAVAKEIVPIAADVELLKAEVTELKADVAVLKEDAPISKDAPQPSEDDLLPIKEAIVARAIIGFAMLNKSQKNQKGRPLMSNDYKTPDHRTYKHTDELGCIRGTVTDAGGVLPKKTAYYVVLPGTPHEEDARPADEIRKILQHCEVENLAAYSPPEEDFVPNYDSSKTAQKARQWLGLSDGDTYRFSDYRRAVESKGIKVIDCAANFDCASGCDYSYLEYAPGRDGIQVSLSNPRCMALVIFDDSTEEAPKAIIVIKKALPQVQTFALFHALGHLLLQRKNPDKHFMASHINWLACLCLLPTSISAELLHPHAAPLAPEEFEDEFRARAERLGITVEMVVKFMLWRQKIQKHQYKRYRGLLKSP